MTSSEGSRPAGVWLGIDVGTVRVGVSRSDPRGVLAVPVETVARDRKRGTDMERVAAILHEHDAVGVVVGLPVTLSGGHGSSVQMAREFGRRLAARIEPIPVVYADERLSTTAATRTLTELGVRGRKGRAVIDQAAAVEILQRWLDAGRPVTNPEDE